MDEETQEEQQPKATWDRREFKINERMREVCRAATVATEAEIKGLKRKLEKLQYGS